MCVKGAQKKGRPRSVGSAFIIRAACYRQEFRPSVVAMADRMLITVWMIIFQVSLFLIIIIGLRTPSAPFGASDLRRTEDCAPLTAARIDV